MTTSINNGYTKLAEALREISREVFREEMAKRFTFFQEEDAPPAGTENSVVEQDPPKPKNKGRGAKDVGKGRVTDPKKDKRLKRNVHLRKDKP